MKKIWIDITNTPHVNVLIPIIKELKHHYELIITARNFSETVPLLKKNNIEPMIIGDYKGKSRTNKIFGLIKRIIDLYYNIPPFDLSLSLGGNYTSTIAKLRNRKSVIFSDNDLSFKGLAFRYADYFIFPSYFDDSYFKSKYKVSSERILKFNGFKEDIYLADFKPDPNFISLLPFDDFITIRPENLKASYVPSDSKTLVPQLFEIFNKENILFLPRYFEEREYANGYNNIFIPDEPLHGLDVCYYTRAMLTGAGTFAREAALLGTPAVSFFPGQRLLSVDKIMVEQGVMIHSRNPKIIKDYVIDKKKNFRISDNSRLVKKEVIEFIKKVIETID
jgi:predicted glycosyltransferase